MNEKVIKAIGTTATLVGMAASLVSMWVKDQQLDNLVANKVNEILNKAQEES